MISKIFKNSMSNSASFVVEAAVAFAMMPFVIHYLGDTGYGIWVLINALTGYLGLFKLGFRPSINKHIAHYKALEDYNSLREFVGASLHLYLYVAVAIVITVLSLSYFLPQIFDVDENYIQIFQILFLFAGMQSVFALVGTAFGGVISGYQRYEINAGIEIGVILVRAGLILYFLPIFDNLYTVAAAHFSITIIGNLITIYVARKVAPLKNLPVLSKPGKEVLEIIIKYNAVSFSIAALGIVVSYLDTVIVGIILPLSAITHYVIGDRLVKYCIMFLNVSTKVIAPAISELDAMQQRERLNSILIMTHKVACIAVYPILICLIIQGDEFIKLWVGDGYDKSYQVMLVLAVSALLVAPSQPINSFLFGLSKHKYLLVVRMAEAVVSIPACIVLGNIYGLVGIAVGISLPRAIMRGIVLPLAISRFCEINILYKFINSNLLVLAGAMPFAAFLFIVRENFNIISWPVFSFQLMIACMLYLLSLYLIVLNREEKGVLKLFIKKINSK